MLPRLVYKSLWIKRKTWISNPPFCTCWVLRLQVDATEFSYVVQGWNLGPPTGSHPQPTHRDFTIHLFSLHWVSVRDRAPEAKSHSRKKRGRNYSECIKMYHVTSSKQHKNTQTCTHTHTHTWTHTHTHSYNTQTHTFTFTHTQLMHNPCIHIPSMLSSGNISQSFTDVHSFQASHSQPGTQ